MSLNKEQIDFLRTAVKLYRRCITRNMPTKINPEDIMSRAIPNFRPICFNCLGSLEKPIPKYEIYTNMTISVTELLGKFKYTLDYIMFPDYLCKRCKKPLLQKTRDKFKNKINEIMLEAFIHV